MPKRNSKLHQPPKPSPNTQGNRHRSLKPIKTYRRNNSRQQPQSNQPESQLNSRTTTRQTLRKRTQTRTIQPPRHTTQPHLSQRRPAPKPMLPTQAAQPDQPNNPQPKSLQNSSRAPPSRTNPPTQKIRSPNPKTSAKLRNKLNPPRIRQPDPTRHTIRKPFHHNQQTHKTTSHQRIDHAS